jgi:hypothetical protein
MSVDVTKCYFCKSDFVMDGDPEWGLYAEEVGEFWSESMQDSVLAHPDCLPRGISPVIEGTDPEWKLA